MHLRHECVYTSIKLYTYSGPEKMSWSIHSFCNEKNGFRTKTHKPQRQSWNIWTKPGGWALENHQPDAIVFHQPQEPANYLIFQNLSKPSLGNIGDWIHLDTDFCQGDHKGPLKLQAAFSAWEITVLPQPKAPGTAAVPPKVTGKSASMTLGRTGLATKHGVKQCETRRVQGAKSNPM